jgi:hypothetical protein
MLGHFVKRPRWSDDKLCYARLLRLQGLRGKNLKKQIYKMELKELHALSLLPFEPVEPKIRVSNDVEIDMAWVVGVTCSEKFEELTFQERWLLFLLYHGDDHGIPTRTYRRTLRVIQDKLRRN